MSSGTNTSAIIVGSTLYGRAFGLRMQTASASASLLVTAVNTIVRGETADVALQANVAGGSVTAQFRNSNYESASYVGAGSGLDQPRRSWRKPVGGAAARERGGR